MAGRNLTPEQVASLEEKLATDPDDAATRTQLLGYYGGRRSIRDQSAKESKRQHVLWFIRNSPESEILGMPYSQVNHILDRDGYAETKEAWMSQIEREPETRRYWDMRPIFSCLGIAGPHQIAGAGSIARSVQPGMAEETRAHS